ncbi:MAG: hypothetical protein V7604_1990 [Hyphomicrobiales bacterium]|jgi:hypothetical protein
MVEKKGRKPLVGERYPCGKRRPTDFRSEGQFQRMKAHAMSLGLDPMMTSQAGRLFCVGLLTSRHMATIDYIAKVYAAYEKHAGKGTRRRTRSPSYEPSTDHAERLEETFEEESDALTAKAEFEQLQALIPDFPREARDAIERLCVDDLMIPSAWIGDLCILLTMIEECRSGTRAAVKLSRANLPLRRRTAKALADGKPLTREEKFGAGAYAAAIAPDAKPGKPSELSGVAADEAARDRAGLTRMLERGNERRAARAVATRESGGMADKPGPGG